MNNVRTVSDTKRAFYTLHTHPINSIYRRIVEELMVEMHLLSVNADFRYDPIYGLGVVTVFDRFMQGYRPEADKASIFNALCRSIERDPGLYQQSAELVRSQASQVSSVADVLVQVETASPGGDSLAAQFRAIADHSTFKYSRLFGIGLFSLVELIEPEAIKDEKRLAEILSQLCEVLRISAEKLQKDLELYRSNLDKVLQAQIVMQDILAADRKKKAERAQAKEALAGSGDTPEDAAS